MEQHPVPRQITTFEFQLVGKLTIKQFIYLAGGAAVAVVLFFLTPSVLFLNWIIAGLPVLIAVGFAFIPINERPLEVWVHNLIKRIMSPTQYYYHKRNKPPAIMLGIQLPPREVMAAYLQAKQKLADYEFTAKNRNKNEESTIEENRQQRVREVQQIQVVKAPQIPLSPVMAFTALTLQQTQTPEPPPPPVATAPPPPPPTESQPEPVEETSDQGVFTVSGSVVSINNIPLPGMLVYVKHGSETVRIMKTNAQGAFANAIPLPNGPYELIVEDPLKKYAFATMVIDHRHVPITVRGQRG